MAPGCDNYGYTGRQPLSPRLARIPPHRKSRAHHPDTSRQIAPPMKLPKRRKLEKTMPFPRR
ncbi:hypothetical protein E2C01_017393 [Portunus trituberculatus]|uniref:Uncharacterized protein n=1 Tax=Portunus trituberculatus TaxID=210409 RepID=A0A5B7DRJ1_PORTR|nr:hypothetical protein [Portunus trituberculatus]